MTRTEFIPDSPAPERTSFRSRFGPLFYSVLGIAILLTSGFFLTGAWTQRSRDQLVQQLFAQLRDSDSNVREDSADRLLSLGVDYTPVLIEMLSDSDTELRSFAVRQLCSLPPTDDDVLVALTAALDDEDDVIRCSVAYAISRFGSSSAGRLDEPRSAAVERLCAMRSDSDARVRRYALQALGQFASRSDQALRALYAALDDDDLSTRLWAAWFLHEIDAESLPLLRDTISAARASDDPEAHDFADSILLALEELKRERAAALDPNDRLLNPPQAE